MKRIICFFIGHDSIIVREFSMWDINIWDHLECRRCTKTLSESWPGQVIPMSTGDWNKGAKNGRT